MSDVIYSTEALATGAGRDGHVTTADGALDLNMSIPKEMGGAGDGFNPEQLFAAGYATCFHSALQAAARGMKITITDSSVGARVDVVRNPETGMDLAVTLEVVLPNLEHDQAQELADAAHKLCPYSRATSGNITVNVVVTDD